MFINPEWPFIGASPDGIIECLCHGRGTQCPYCHRGEDIVNVASNDKNFCLKKDTDGSLHLDPNHAYYYQIQMQLFVCDVDYCDFCVATFADSGNRSGLHVEQIYKNSTLWSQCVKQSSVFLVNVFFPSLWEAGLLGLLPVKIKLMRAYKVLSHNLLLKPVIASLPTYCYCHGPESGRMLACDNEECRIDWFHLECLKMDESMIPKGKWYCPDCRKKEKCSTKGKGKSKAKNL